MGAVGSAPLQASSPAPAHARTPSSQARVRRLFLDLGGVGVLLGAVIEVLASGGPVLPVRNKLFGRGAPGRRPQPPSRPQGSLTKVTLTLP